MKKIELNNGMSALVDDEDFEYLSRWRWTAKPHRNTWYANRGEYYAGKQTHHSLHRIVLGVTIPETLVDHIDGNGLNCQKSNLRIATPPQNRHNLKGFGKSKYPGVTQRGKKWIARIRPEGKHFYLGTFDTEEGAAQAYRNKAQELYGEFVRKVEDINV